MGRSGRLSFVLLAVWAAGCAHRRQPDPLSASHASGFDPYERLEWAGRVEGEAVVECRAAVCRAEGATGASVHGSGPLPLQTAEIRLADVQARGQVEIIQQPTSENGFTVKVRIRDPQPGAEEYRFTLLWTRPNRMSR